MSGATSPAAWVQTNNLSGGIKMSKYKPGNFIQIDRSLFKIPKFNSLASSTKWLYICLSELEHRYTSKEKKDFYQSDQAISDMSGIPLRSFKRCKKELVEKGFILLTKKKTPRGDFISSYILSEKIHFDDYKEYLNGDHWKGVAKKKRKSSDNRCEKCGAKGKISVHHKNYKNLHHESMKDLLSLCDSCHKKIHGIN
jgi:hypothetical protein